MNLNERIKALRTQRAELLKKSQEISDKVALENRLFTDEEQKLFDDLLAQVQQVDKNLEALLVQERLLAGVAAPVEQPGNDPGTIDTERAPPAPSGLISPQIKFTPCPGQAFTRYVMAMANSKNQLPVALQIAQRWRHETPEVAIVIEAQMRSNVKMTDAFIQQRAAVASGTTTDATWAGPLIYAQNLVAEFINFLRPQTIVGRLSLRPIPFNVRIPRQTAGALAQWVGEGLSKPVGRLSFDAITVPWAKMALIMVITQELSRFSNPAAEMLVRDDLVEAMSQFKDQQFIDPSVAALANVRPGAITNGIPAGNSVASTGQTFAAINHDVETLLISMATHEMPLTRPVWIMTPAAKIILMAVRTAYDIYAYPTVAANNTFFGYPIITSNNVPSVIGPPVTNPLILIDQNECFYASDNGIDISASEEASLQMDSAPATPPTPLVSLWQQNMLGLKAEEYNYWLRRRDYAVGMITAFNNTPV